MAVMTCKEVMEEGVIGPQAGMTTMKIKGGILPTEGMTLEEVGHPQAPQAQLEALPPTQATSPVSAQKTWLRQICQGTNGGQGRHLEYLRGYTPGNDQYTGFTMRCYGQHIQEQVGKEPFGPLGPEVKVMSPPKPGKYGGQDDIEKFDDWVTVKTSSSSILSFGGSGYGLVIRPKGYIA